LHCSRLLSDNAISSTIPSGISNLTHLLAVDLSNNLLQGTIPSELESLHALQSLFVSGNLLDGTIPAGIFQPNLTAVYVYTVDVMMPTCVQQHLTCVLQVIVQQQPLGYYSRAIELHPTITHMVRITLHQWQLSYERDSLTVMRELLPTASWQTTHSRETCLLSKQALRNSYTCMLSLYTIAETMMRVLTLMLQRPSFQSIIGNCANNLGECQ
jgi:hypothetical protein